VSSRAGTASWRRSALRSCVVPAWGKCWDVSGGEVRIVGRIGGGWVVGGQNDVMSIPSAKGKPDRTLSRDGEGYTAGWAEVYGEQA
jgi:hypothetical protein